MINVEGRIFIRIKIDGRPLSGANLVSSISLLEGGPVLFPSLIMHLNDESGHLSKDLCLTDSNSIVISIGTSPDDIKTVTRQYRLHAFRGVETAEGPMLSITGVYDAPLFTTQAAIESFSGNTSIVLKQIADKCKLYYSGPEEFNGRTPQDQQVWINASKTRAAYAYYDVARHGYLDQHSAMCVTLTGLGELRYRNLADVVETPLTKIKYAFLHNLGAGNSDAGRQVYHVKQARSKSDAGYMNRLYNYGSARVSSGLSGVDEINEKVEVKTSGKFLPINNQVYQTVQRTRVEHDPIDCGNVSDTFYKAEYQNKKQLALFSERVSLLVDEPTEVQLYDPVIYRQADIDPVEPAKLTDVYVVVAKTVHSKGGKSYAERIELVRRSLTEMGDGVLKSADPTTVRESAVPVATIDTTVQSAVTNYARTSSISDTLKAPESAWATVKNKVGDVASSAKLLVPQMTTLAADVQNIATSPLQMLESVNASLAGIQNYYAQVQQFKGYVDAAKDAARSGNVLLLAQGVSGVVGAASFFKSNGIVQSVCSTLGITKVIGTASSFYNGIAQQLSIFRYPMDAVSGGAQIVDDFINSVAGINNQYAGILNGLGSSWNSTVSMVSGSNAPIGGDLLPYASNNFRLQSIVDSSLGQSRDLLSVVKPISDIQTEVRDSMSTTDSFDRPVFVSEQAWAVVPTSVSDMGSQLNQFNTELSQLSRQLRLT